MLSPEKCATLANCHPRIDPEKERCSICELILKQQAVELVGHYSSMCEESPPRPGVVRTT